MKARTACPAIAAAILSIALLTGCATAPDASSAKAASNDWPRKLTIVQMPDENNPDAGEKHEGFRTAMQDALGLPVEELEGTEYAVGIEAMKNGKLDVLLVSPMSYYQAKTVANVEPLVTTQAMSAQPYKTVFVTRSDRDDIQSIEDLRGKTFAFVDPASSSGYMYPKAHLVTKLGLDAEQVETPGYFFQTVAYSGKHDTSLVGVTMGDYDAAAVAYQIIGQLADAGMIDEGDIKIIGETDVIPNACFVMRADLPASLKEEIRAFYLQYDDASYFEAFYKDPSIRFVEAKDEEYAVVDQMVKILGIEQ